MQVFSIKIFFVLTLLVSAHISWAQQRPRPLQLSGLVLDGTEDRLLPVGYANIYVMGKGRGTYSDYNGFFSLVVERGDSLEFSAIGYKTVYFVVPDSMSDDRYSMVQLMTEDTVNLPTAVVFPWPSKEHFKLEFLAMDVSAEMQERAMRNLANERLRDMQVGVQMDANENADYYLRQQANRNYYIGQTPPMNIFNPLAWKEFFDAWKRGDFKKKGNR